MEKIFKLQQEIGKISKTQENPFYKSRYFDINKLLEQLMPLLEKYNLVISQPLTTVNERPAIETSIIDTETKDVLISGTITLPDIQDPQKMGSAITYYRRYAIQSMLGLQAEDDDGNLASNKGNKNQYEQKENTKDKQQNNLYKVQIQKFLDANSNTKLSTKEEYEKFCLDNLGIELKEENYQEIINLISNN